MQFKTPAFVALLFAAVSLATPSEAPGKRLLWERNCPGGGNQGICAEGQFCCSDGGSPHCIDCGLECNANCV